MKHAAHLFEHRLGDVIPARRGATWCPRIVWNAPVAFDPDAPTRGTPLAAYANHGRWVVDCDQCTGAQLVCLTDLRFVCVECGNAHQGGAFRPVKMPTALEELGALLDERGDQRMRNWSPGESVKQIRDENKLLREAVEL